MLELEIPVLDSPRHVQPPQLKPRHPGMAVGLQIPGICCGRSSPTECSVLQAVLIFLPASFSHRDLSENFIQAIPRKAFRGATDLKNL